MLMQDDLIRGLLIAIGSGDRKAFRRLYDATSSYLMTILIRKLGKRELAEEVLQDCYIKVWQRANTYDPARGQAMAWLATLVRNKAVDAIRARRPDEFGLELQPEDGMLFDDSADPSRDAEIAETLQSLEESFSKLPLKMRTSILLTHHSGYSHEESARLMQAPLGTVKAWVRRGVEQLRNDFAHQNEIRVG